MSTFTSHKPSPGSCDFVASRFLTRSVHQFLRLLDTNTLTDKLYVYRYIYRVYKIFDCGLNVYKH